MTEPKLLYHAFPRARQDRSEPRRLAKWLPHDQEDLERGFLILANILEHGLLCTPEQFGMYADPQSERPEKLEALAAGRPYASITQSRACFTLMARHELADGTDALPSHMQIFGPFSIGFDPVRARSLGICPVFYYYRHAHSAGNDTAIAGLGEQIVSRLGEMATIFTILSRIESIARPSASWGLPEHVLDELELHPKFEGQVEKMLAGASKRDAEQVLRYFDTDRVASWNIVDFIHMLLALYQSADSTLDGSALTFFNQREWRLVFHTRRGLKWIGLGAHPRYRNPDAAEMCEHRTALRRLLAGPLRRHSYDERYLRDCWALHTVDDGHLRDFVSEILVPERFLEETRQLLSKYRFAFGTPLVYAAGHRSH